MASLAIFTNPKSHILLFSFFFFPNCPFFFLSLPKGHISGTPAISEAMLFPPFPPHLALSPRFSSAPALPACSKNPGAMPAGPPAGCCSISSAVPAPAERQRRAEPSRAEPGRARHSGLEQTPAQQQDAKCHFLAENTLLSHACRAQNAVNSANLILFQYSKDISHFII